MLYSGSYPFLFENLSKTVEQIRKANPTAKLTFIISSNNMRRVIKEYLSEKHGILYNSYFYTKLDIAKELTGFEPIESIEKEIIIDRILKDMELSIEGLSKYFSEAIQNLKEYQIDSKKLPEGSILREVFNRYQELLNQLDLKDREDILFEGSKIDYKTDFIFFIGFHTLTSLDRILFENLIKNRVFVFIPIHRSYGITEKIGSIKGTYQFFKKFRLKEIAEKIDTDLKKIASYLFTNKIEDLNLNLNNLHYIKSKGKKDEIVKLAKTILTVKNKTDWRKIGVVINNIEDYINEIKTVFNEYKIPYYLSNENRFIDQMFFKRIFSLFKLKDYDFQKSEVLKVLTGFLLNIEKEEIKKSYQKIYKSFHETGYKNLIKILEDNNSTSIKDLLSEIYTLPDISTIEEYVKKYYEITLKYIKNSQEKDKFLNILENLNKNDVFKKLFKEISLNDFNDLVHHYLKEEDLEKRLKGDIVQVRTPTKSEGLIFDYVFFIDMNEGRFPSSIKEDPIIDEKLRKSLEEIGFPDKFSPYWQQITTFISIFNSSSNIYIFYKDRDDRGNELSKSVLVDELMRIQFGFNSDEISSKENSVNSEILSLREFKIKISKEIANSDQILKKLIDANIKRRSETLTEFDGLVSDFDYKSLRLSPTKLQTYSDCPQKFFLKEVLGIETEDTLEYERIPPDIEGTVIHSILEEIYRKKIRDHELISEIILERITKNLYPLLNFLKPSVRIFEELRLSFLQKILVDFIINDLERIDGKYYVELIEKEESIFIQELNFRGKIDRADRSLENNQYTIFDYKSGKKRTSDLRKSLLKGDYLQLIIYKKFLEKQGKKVEKVGLLFVKEPRPDETIPIYEEIENLFNEILKLLTEYIKKGYFFPYKEGNNCLYCEFYDICIIYETFEKIDKVFKNFQMLKEGKLFS